MRTHLDRSSRTSSRLRSEYWTEAYACSCDEACAAAQSSGDDDDEDAMFSGEKERGKGEERGRYIGRNGTEGEYGAETVLDGGGWRMNAYEPRAVGSLGAATKATSAHKSSPATPCRRLYKSACSEPASLAVSVFPLYTHNRPLTFYIRVRPTWPCTPMSISTPPTRRPPA